MQKQQRKTVELNAPAPQVQEEQARFVVGFDCGYSNVKVAYGYANADEPTVMVRPANAATLDKLNGQRALKDQERSVFIDGQEWFAFTVPSRSAMPRVVHDKYPASETYLALFLATIDECCENAGTTVINRLVTGLPVNQARDEKEVAALTQRLQGVHEVSNGRVIEVQEVVVIAQPIGTLYDVHSTYDRPKLLERGNVLVFDVGFYSCDWVLFCSGDLVRDSSDSSMEAMSVFIKAINDAIVSELGGKGPGSDKIEMALREGETEIVYNGNELNLETFMERAAATVCRAALAKLQAGQRFQDSAIDFVILSGGGGAFYGPAISEILPDSKLLAPNEPVVSNSIGFWCQGI